MEPWSRSSSNTTKMKEDEVADYGSSTAAGSRKYRDSSSRKDLDRSRNSRDSYQHGGRYDRDRYGASTSYRSYDDRDRRNRDRDRRSNRRNRSRSRSRSSSHESRNKRRYSRDKRSTSYDRKRRSASRDRKYRSSSRDRKYKSPSRERSSGRDRTHRSSSRDRKAVRIVRASRSRSKSKDNSQSNKYNEFTSSDSRNLMEMFKTGMGNQNGEYYQQHQQYVQGPDETDEDFFDKERIHKEMQERLIEHLAREGKVYPPPKPQASHPIFANDGSFLETFKKLQEQQHSHGNMYEMDTRKQSTAAVAAAAASAAQSSQPMFGKRRGGKILKTGIVQKPRIIDEADSTAGGDQNDAWAMYLKEVKKYKNVSCDADSKTRPLVK